MKTLALLLVVGNLAFISRVAPAAATMPPKRSLVERAACSSLAQARQPTDKALQEIAALGFHWVDLACLNWAPHASVPRLLESFDPEAARVEAALATNGLRVANLTFDAPDNKPFDQYEKEFAAVVRLAVRLKARLINVMAPSAKADRAVAVEHLRKMQETASRAGVMLTVETHVGQITERPADALWLCQQVPGLGLTLDPSHYFAGTNQGASFEQLYRYVQGTGFRAGGMNWATIQMPWNEGPIDFADMVRKLEARGYRGFYVAEYIEGFNQLNALEQSRRFLDWMKKQ